MKNLNREQLLTKITEYMAKNQSVSVPQIQSDFGVGYKEARLLVADLVGAEALRYDGGLIYNVREDFKKNSLRLIRRDSSKDGDGAPADKNAAALCEINPNLHFGKDEIMSAMAKAMSKTWHSSAKPTVDAKIDEPEDLEKRKRELMDKLKKIAEERGDNDDDDDDYDDDDVDDTDEIFNQITQDSLDEIIYADYETLSKDAKDILKWIIVKTPEKSMAETVQEINRTERLQAHLGKKTDAHEELKAFVTSMTEDAYTELKRRILLKK